jgi:hypothetical protein
LSHDLSTLVKSSCLLPIISLQQPRLTLIRSHSGLPLRHDTKREKEKKGGNGRFFELAKFGFSA